MLSPRKICFSDHKNDVLRQIKIIKTYVRRDRYLSQHKYKDKTQKKSFIFKTGSILLFKENYIFQVRINASFLLVAVVK